MKVIWLPDALLDRAEIMDFVASDNPVAAIDLDDRFGQLANLLLTTPHMGRPGRIEGTRELVAHPNYVMIYEIGEDRISILAIYHTSRQWPPEWNRHT